MKKTAFIVGASSGIGLAVAEKLTKNYNVYCGARRECPNKNVKSITLDASEKDSLKNAVDKIIEETGRIDVFIYSAGFSMAAPTEKVLSEDYRYLFDVNFFGALEGVKHVIPHMRNGGGRIILISSLGGVLPIAYDPFYSASKAALNIVAKELYLELKPYDISVTSFMPGGTATDFTSKRKVYNREQSGIYYGEQTRAVTALAETEQTGMPAEEVADEIIKILNRKYPPAVAAAGFINTLFYLAEKFLPDKLVRAILLKQYDLSS